MFGIPSTLAASFPQNTANRTWGQAKNDLSIYVGGENDPLSADRARVALSQAIRTMNIFAWKFNRMQQTISWTANTSDYGLNADFRSPRKATLLDSNSKAVGRLDWIPFDAYTRIYDVRLGTSSYPIKYTARNIHEVGQVTIYPPMGPIPSTNYPSAQLDYHRRILIPGADASVINVPQEVEEVIFQMAIIIGQAMFRNQPMPSPLALLINFASALEAEYRDYPDYGMDAGT